MIIHSLLKSAVVAVCCVGIATVSSAQDQRFVMKLNNELIDSFKSYGSLKSSVPEEARDKIGFVELQFADSQGGEPVELDLGLTVSNQEATIILDNDLIDKIKGQPLRVPVREGSDAFAQVLLIYDAPTQASRLPIVKDSSGNPMDMVYVRMSDVQVMGGGIEALKNLELKTKFGPVTIPMDQVAGVRFHIDNEDSAVVVLVNGDTVTGVPALSDLDLVTDWGTATIDAEFVESITTTANARFRQEEGDFGPRWALDTGTSIAPGAPSR